MMKISLIAVLFSSAHAFAAASVTCYPQHNGGYFSETATLTVLSDQSIEVNGVALQLDPTYKPRKPTALKRYTGDTEEASGWADSGAVEIFFDGKKALRFTVRGEIFIDETLICTK